MSADAGTGYKYSREEITALKSLFDSCDRDRTGRIHINQLPGLLSKLGKDEDEIIAVTEVSSKKAEGQEGTLTFHDIIQVLEKLETSTQTPFEGPDPKVIEFLRILEEYRIKCK
jgi:Ca2+-binding EF-hand superfamily protein